VTGHPYSCYRADTDVNQSINHIFCSVGTIRSDRLLDCNLKSEKELKKVGRGAVESRVEKKSGIHLVRWLDNYAVQLSSTHAAVESTSTLRC